jgi:penicillin amidase
MEDSVTLQHDTYSLRGAADQPAFRGWQSKDPDVERARNLVASWDAMLGKDSVAAAIYITWRRMPDQPIESGLRKAIQALSTQFGPDWSQWRYGRVHMQAFSHPVLSAFDLPTVERRGGNGAVGADGATYREIIDVSNWDRSLTINTPGQSGQPGSPFYGNLLPLWANDDYFPMTFSRKAVDANAAHRLTLRPQ